jgi:hypothetical protein
VINFPTRLNHHFIYLRGSVDASEVGLIQGAVERFDDLMSEWNAQRDTLNALLGPRLERFNALIVESGVSFVAAPESSP